MPIHRRAAAYCGRKVSQWRRSWRSHGRTLTRGSAHLRRCQLESLEDRRLLAFDTPLLNIDGQGPTGIDDLPNGAFIVMPVPDTVGDVGTDHYIQMVNAAEGSQFTVYDKKTGQILLGPVVTSSLATPGSACTLGAGDPIVLYDHLADRWLISEFRPPSLTQNGMCVYISQTSDPTDGQWYDYYIPTVASFPDYPKFAVWPSAFVVTTNEATSTVYALDRANMLRGLPMRAPIRDIVAPLPAFLFQSLTPADLDGPAPPPGSPAYVMRHRDDELHFGTDPIELGGFGTVPFDPWHDYLEIYQVDMDFERTQLSITRLPDIRVSEFDSDLCAEALSCLPQPPLGGVASPGLDAISQVIMHRLQYRNFGAYETLVGNFTVDTNQRDHAGIRWFELRKPRGGSWQLHQEGNVMPDRDNRFMGSIAMDGQGNIALAYSVTSLYVSPSLRYVGRRASDPLGTMPLGEHVIVDGIGAQIHGPRWGDYSAMSVDPVDDATFYFTGQYANGNDWATRIAAMSIERPRSDFPPGPGRQISGLKWNDTNGNGRRDPGEPTLEQQKIYIDLNDDARLGIGEPLALTDRDGRYRFEDLDPGTYVIREILDPGWEQTYPDTADGSHVTTVYNQGGPVNISFGNRLIPGIEFESDFGDAPAPFPTRAEQNAAVHQIVPGFGIGPLIDGEGDGQPTSQATGDDLNGPDEDGVIFSTDLIPGQTATVQVTIQNGDHPSGVLQAWIDFDADGAWTSAGEQIFRDVAVHEGVNTLTFTVPAWAVLADTFARFRYGYERGISFTGEAVAGEVEDHLVQIERGGPTANPDFFTARRNSRDNELDVLANDDIRPGSGTRITSVSTPTQSGAVTIASDGLGLLYAPAEDFTGLERFTYTLTDAEGLQDATLVEVFVQPDFVSLSLRAADLEGSPITEIQVGEEFLLQGTVEDLTPLGSGVFAAYMDVEFSSVAATVAGPIEYGPEYPFGQSGSTELPGLIDEVGAFDGVDRLGPGEFLLFSIPMTAERLGSVDFVANPADVLPQHSVLLFDRDDPVLPDRIEYGSFTLPIVAGSDELQTNPLDPLDVNADTIISPLDALLVINELNDGDAARAARAVSAQKLFLDVNGDRILSPLDALIVINELNRTSAEAEPDGLAAVAAAVAASPRTVTSPTEEEGDAASPLSDEGSPRSHDLSDSDSQRPRLFDGDEAIVEPVVKELNQDDLAGVLDVISDDVAKAKM